MHFRLPTVIPNVCVAFAEFTLVAVMGPVVYMLAVAFRLAAVIICVTVAFPVTYTFDALTLADVMGPVVYILAVAFTLAAVIICVTVAFPVTYTFDAFTLAAVKALVTVKLELIEDPPFTLLANVAMLTPLQVTPSCPLPALYKPVTSPLNVITGAFTRPGEEKLI